MDSEYKKPTKYMVIIHNFSIQNAEVNFQHTFKWEYKFFLQIIYQKTWLKNL